jgi:transposase
MIASMQQPWTVESLEPLRRLAVERVLEGESPGEVAEFLNVSVRSIQRWVRGWQQSGDAALLSRPKPGRPPKLTGQQTESVLCWLDLAPSHFGFPTERWTAPRLAWLIEREFGVSLNHRYLNDWLRHHGVTPQMPGRQAKERDEELIAGWIRYQWPRIKKRPAT